MMDSPYKNLPVKKWLTVTRELVENHPLRSNQIIEAVLGAWHSIFASKFGAKGFRIGTEIFPKPQIMGFLLHELIPLELSARYPKLWRGELSAGDKDIVYIPDQKFSIEVKTSSNPNHIFGNRSYAQEASSDKKAKSGYYIAVNFQKFLGGGGEQPSVVLIRFGWLDSSDWIGQKAATGQQSRLTANAENYKFLELYRNV